MAKKNLFLLFLVLFVGILSSFTLPRKMHTFIVENVTPVGIRVSSEWNTELKPFFLAPRETVTVHTVIPDLYLDLQASDATYQADYDQIGNLVIIY